MKHHHMHNHSNLWMILVCVLPMTLIFILPALGIEIGAFWLLFPLLCAGSHLLMMRGHHRDNHDHPHDRLDERRDQ
jgi:hypothetical protein